MDDKLTKIAKGMKTSDKETKSAVKLFEDEIATIEKEIEKE